MLHTKVVDIKDKKLSIIDAEKFISSSDFGASIFFSGTVRNQNNNKSVTGITYDSHDALVIKSFEEIYNEADQKLKIKDKAVFIEHAKGFLNLSEISIIIAASKHANRGIHFTDAIHEGSSNYLSAYFVLTVNTIQVAKIWYHSLAMKKF